MIRILALAVSLLGATLFAGESAVLTLSQTALATRNITGSIALTYDNDGFTVFSENGSNRVASYNIDVFLRRRSVEEIAKFTAINRVLISQISDSEYTIAPAGGLKGGGPIGATIGSALGYGFIKGAVCAIVAGAGLATTAVAGPVFGAGVAGGLQAVLQPLSEPIAWGASIAGGILVGTATGPM